MSSVANEQGKEGVAKSQDVKKHETITVFCLFV